MASVVNVCIHSEISEFPTEKRYDPKIKISELKEKLELITGANHKTMKIIMTVEDKPEVELSNNDETFAHYLGQGVTKETTVKLKVHDDQAAGLLQGDVPKLTISEEKYQQRSNVREFIKQKREQLAAANNQ